MARVLLTDLLIRKLPIPETPIEIADAKVAGLRLVNRPSGVKSWIVRYRRNGKPAKYTIEGHYPAVSLLEARRRALEAVGSIAAGKDPAGEKKASRDAAKAGAEAVHHDLVEIVVNSFVERYAKRETRDWRETQRLLNREIVGAWKGRRLSQIGKADVYAILDEAVDRGAPSTARHAFAAFRVLCGWAVSRGIIEKNPCDGVSAPSAAPSRDRVLDEDEIRLVWPGLRHDRRLALRPDRKAADPDRPAEGRGRRPAMERTGPCGEGLAPAEGAMQERSRA